MKNDDDDDNDDVTADGWRDLPLPLQGDEEGGLLRWQDRLAPGLWVS